MQSLRYYNAVLTSLLIWLVVSWSGACGHFCLDGSEPPLSVHGSTHSLHSLENNHHTDDHHAELSAEPAHIDITIDLSQWLSVKLLKLDLPILLALVFLFVALLLPRQIFARSYRFRPCSQRLGLRPPLRAPPAFPA